MSQLYPIKQNNLTRPICPGSDRDQTKTKVWIGTKTVENKRHLFLAFPAFDPVSGFNYLHCFYSHVSR